MFVFYVVNIWKIVQTVKDDYCSQLRAPEPDWSFFAAALPLVLTQFQLVYILC